MVDESRAAEILDRYPPLREMQAVPLFRDLGYRFSDAGEGWCEIRFVASERAMNLYGIVHGGVWLLLSDSAMGGALATVQAPGERLIAGQADFRWLRPLDGDGIRVRAEVLRRGRSLSHCASDFYDDRDRHIAHGSGTYVVLPPLPEQG
ncbi:MAG: PaaI family thioesterase [Proteobacteria bacterium]|nr:PaaI family thioesterase [Pseudomonadota bacterium]